MNIEMLDSEFGQDSGRKQRNRANNQQAATLNNESLQGLLSVSNAE